MDVPNGVKAVSVKAGVTLALRAVFSVGVDVTDPT